MSFAIPRIDAMGDATTAVAASSTDGLVARLRRGDPQAVAQVYDAYHHQVRAFARRLVGNDASAEDLVHDVFVSLPGAIKRFRDEA